MPEDFYYYYLFILFLNRPHRVVLGSIHDNTATAHAPRQWTLTNITEKTTQMLSLIVVGETA